MQKTVRLNTLNWYRKEKGAIREGSIKYVYRITKPEICDLPTFLEKLEELKRKGIIELAMPVREEDNYESSYTLGNIHEKSYYAFYAEKPPILLHVVTFSRGEREDSFTVIYHDTQVL
ncbi:MAG: hypothetical protein QXU69_09945 [Thermofilaceae archaeon]